MRSLKFIKLNQFQ